MTTSPLRRYVGCVLGVTLLAIWQRGTPAVVAAPEAAPPLELKQLLREAMENNPDIRAAQQRWAAARAVIPQVKTWPDPMLNLGYGKVEEREVMYGFSQEIPFPGKLQLRGEVARGRPSASSRNTWRYPYGSSHA